MNKTMDQLSHMIPAQYFWILLGVLVVFSMGTVFFMVKVKRDDFTHEAAGLKQMASQHKALKEKLSDSERQKQMLQDYIALSEDSRKVLMDKIKKIDDEKN